MARLFMWPYFLPQIISSEFWLFPLPHPHACHPLPFTSPNYIISHRYNMFKYFAQRNSVTLEPWVRSKLSNTSVIERS